MRAARRFRPDFALRPGLDLLPRRAVPSDISTMITTNPDPLPVGTDPAYDPDNTDPLVIGPVPICTYPNGYTGDTGGTTEPLTTGSPSMPPVND